jgi:beta-glucosidase
LSDAASNSSISNDTIVSDTYFYGSSPPVYLSPSGDGRSGWQDAYNKAAALVSQMTIEEKV